MCASDVRVAFSHEVSDVVVPGNGASVSSERSRLYEGEHCVGEGWGHYICTVPGLPGR